MATTLDATAWEARSKELTFSGHVFVANESVDARSGDADLWVERGRCFAGLRQWDKVAADFAKALSLLPNTRSAAYQRTAIWDELIQWDQAFSKVTAARPRDGYSWRARGRVDARRGRWKEAAAALARSMKLQVPDDAEIWFEHACLRLLSGDTDGYRATCAQMLEAVEKKQRPLRAYLVARACTLAPNAVADIKRPARVANQELMDNRVVYWSLAEQGALKYRAGRFDEALERLGLGLHYYPDWDGNILNHLWMAMTQYQLGKKEFAGKTLAKAEAWFAKYGKEMPTLKNWTYALHLHDWLEAHILFREARALIKGKAPVALK